MYGLLGSGAIFSALFVIMACGHTGTGDVQGCLPVIILFFLAGVLFFRRGRRLNRTLAAAGVCLVCRGSGRNTIAHINDTTCGSCAGTGRAPSW